MGWLQGLGCRARAAAFSLIHRRALTLRRLPASPPQGDARELGPEFWGQHAPAGFDAVLSDLCHFTLGNSVADAFKSLELARTAWGIATGGEAAEAADPNAPWSRGVLKPGGSLVMKLLQGSGARVGGAQWRLGGCMHA